MDSKGTLYMRKALGRSDQLETLELRETYIKPLNPPFRERHSKEAHSSSRLLEFNFNSFSTRHNSQAESRGSWGY